MSKEGSSRSQVREVIGSQHTGLLPEMGPWKDFDLSNLLFRVSLAAS